MTTGIAPTPSVIIVTNFEHLITPPQPVSSPERITATFNQPPLTAARGVDGTNAGANRHSRHLVSHLSLTGDDCILNLTLPPPFGEGARCGLMRLSVRRGGDRCPDWRSAKKKRSGATSNQPSAVSSQLSAKKKQSAEKKRSAFSRQRRRSDQEQQAVSHQRSVVSYQRRRSNQHSAISFQGRYKRGKHPLDLNHLVC